MSDDALTSGKLGRITPDRTRLEVIAPWDFADVSALRVSLTLSGERVE